MEQHHLGYCRAKTLQNEIIYGWRNQDPDGMPFIYDDETEIFDFNIDPTSIEMFTGMVTELNALLFEGDEVEVGYYNHNGPITWLKQTIVWGKGCFWVKSPGKEDIADWGLIRHCTLLFDAIQAPNKLILLDMPENYDASEGLDKMINLVEQMHTHIKNEREIGK